MLTSLQMSDRPGRSFGSTVTSEPSSDSSPRTYVSEPPTRPGSSVRRAKPTCSAALGSRRGRLLRAEAFDGAAQAVFEWGFGLVADQVACAGDVEVARGLAVGHGGVPDDLALEA